MAVVRIKQGVKDPWDTSRKISNSASSQAGIKSGYHASDALLSRVSDGANVGTRRGEGEGPRGHVHVLVSVDRARIEFKNCAIASNKINNFPSSVPVSRVIKQAEEQRIFEISKPFNPFKGTKPLKYCQIFSKTPPFACPPARQQVLTRFLITMAVYTHLDPQLTVHHHYHNA
ncbi:hypothetical protein C8F04DRAFT_1180162 [Mycena alexandri]|uniref:Uncharacterized protein n=1 Tax=Mycena alexandri TaxID=1745969 RepID=A0AAD6X787_9AGAR|nr:hypothetical protein C8F04DRAFT_1180162 [Mycena alexandri]